MVRRKFFQKQLVVISMIILLFVIVKTEGEFPIGENYEYSSNETYFEYYIVEYEERSNVHCDFGVCEFPLHSQSTLKFNLTTSVGGESGRILEKDGFHLFSANFELKIRLDGANVDGDKDLIHFFWTRIFIPVSGENNYFDDYNQAIDNGECCEDRKYVRNGPTSIQDYSVNDGSGSIVFLILHYDYNTGILLYNKQDNGKFELEMQLQSTFTSTVFESISKALTEDDLIYSNFAITPFVLLILCRSWLFKIIRRNVRT